MLRTHHASELSAAADGTRATVAGWVKAKRDHGKVLFLIVQDGTGDVQVTCKDKLVETAKALGSEWVIAVQGAVKKNAQAPGGCELIPSAITVLNRAASPLPLDIRAKFESELDTRLDHRYLDLRRPEVQAIFRIKDAIQKSYISYFDEQGFVFMNPPVIVAAATESGAALFPLSYFEHEAFLAQSPQLYKQMLMATGIDKVGIVTPAFRAEEHDTARHLNEVMQMDIEIAFVEGEEDALKYLEGAVNFVCTQVKKRCSRELALLGVKWDVPVLPFKRLTYDEALKLLKKDGITVAWGSDLTPEAERTLCTHADPVIVTKWPTTVRAFYSMPEPGNEKICRAYDLLFGGVEIASGAQRIHREDELVAQMKQRKMNPKNFSFYLNAFRYGMPPHAGWSIGLERLTLILSGKKNIREASLHPRTRTRMVP